MSYSLNNKELNLVVRALVALERLERELRLVKQELLAELPEEPQAHETHIADPVTGRKWEIKTRRKS